VVQSGSNNACNGVFNFTDKTYSKGEDVVANVLFFGIKYVKNLRMFYKQTAEIV
jgi:hypothetical protein